MALIALKFYKVVLMEKLDRCHILFCSAVSYMLLLQYFKAVNRNSVLLGPRSISTSPMIPHSIYKACVIRALTDASDAGLPAF